MRTQAEWMDGVYRIAFYALILAVGAILVFGMQAQGQVDPSDVTDYDVFEVSNVADTGDDQINDIYRVNDTHQLVCFGYSSFDVLRVHVGEVQGSVWDLEGTDLFNGTNTASGNQCSVAGNDNGVYGTITQSGTKALIATSQDSGANWTEKTISYADGPGSAVSNTVLPNNTIANAYFGTADSGSVDTSFPYSNTQSFSVDGTTVVPWGIHFKPDGTSMYVVDPPDADINQYSLSTGWDLDTTTFVSTLDVSGQDGSPRGMHIGPDGDRLYVVGNSNSDIYQYSLSTSWQITSASFVNNFNVSSQDTNHEDVWISDNGEDLYTAGGGNNSIHQFSFSTPWEITSLSHVRSQDVSTQSTDLRDVSFVDSQNKMYLLDNSDQAIYRYSLSTPGDVSTLTFDNSMSVSTETSEPSSLYVREDESDIFIGENDAENVYKYENPASGDSTKVSLTYSFDNGQSWIHDNVTTSMNFDSIDITHVDNETVWFAGTGSHPDCASACLQAWVSTTGINGSFTSNGPVVPTGSQNVFSIELQAFSNVHAAMATATNQNSGGNDLAILTTSNAGADWTTDRSGSGSCDLREPGWVDLQANSVNEYWGSCQIDNSNDALIHGPAVNGGSFTLDLPTWSTNPAFHPVTSIFENNITHYIFLTRDGTDQMTVHRLAGSNPVVDQAAIFGNAQAVRTSWHADEEVYVRDIQDSDTITKLDQNLALDQESFICTDTLQSGDDFDFLGFWAFNRDFFQQWRAILEDSNTIEGLDVARNTTANVLHTCEIIIDYEDESKQDLQTGGVILRNSNLGLVTFNVTGTENEPIVIDALDNINVSFAIEGSTPDGIPHPGGVGNWGYWIDRSTVWVSGGVFSDKLDSDANQVLPIVANLTDVAIDTKVDVTTRLVCYTSTSNGTGCWNENGNEIATDVDLDAEFATVYDNNVYLWNASSGDIDRYAISTGSLSLQSTSPQVGNVVDLSTSKDGRYLVACTTAQMIGFNSTTLEEEWESSPYIQGGSGLRSCDMDTSNNNGYGVDQTTVYKWALFNGTTNPEEEGQPIGTQNPDVAGDTQGADVMDPDDTDGAGTGNVSPFETPSITGLTSTESGLLMAMLTLLLFTGTAYILTQNGAVALVGAVAGFGLAIAFGWVPTWFTVLIVLVSTALIVLGIDNAITRGNDGGPPSPDNMDGEN